jgi:hypothetical protein
MPIVKMVVGSGVTPKVCRLGKVCPAAALCEHRIERQGKDRKRQAAPSVAVGIEPEFEPTANRARSTDKHRLGNEQKTEQRSDKVDPREMLDMVDRTGP